MSFITFSKFISLQLSRGTNFFNLAITPNIYKFNLSIVLLCCYKFFNFFHP